MGGRERAGSFRVIRGPEVRTEGDDVLLREQTFEPVDDGFGVLEVASCYSGVACALIGVLLRPCQSSSLRRGIPCPSTSDDIQLLIMSSLCI